MPLSIAVIGAGLSGLACARQLRAAGHEVTVFEKSHGPGGRAATRRTELGGFDHGAQYFTARDPAFQAEVGRWIAAGAAASWEARIVALDHGVVTPSRGDAVRYVGTPGMSELGKFLSIGLTLHTEQRVVRIERMAHAAGARWALKRLADPQDSASIEVTEGLYDAVVVAVPADQAVDLLEPAAALAAAARSALLEPCWALMLGFAEPLPLDYDAAFVAGPRLAWIARDSAKPQRRSGERWVAHAGPEWSREHLEDDPDDVRQKLQKAFAEATGSAAQPIHAVVHRWRYSIPLRPLPDACLWDAGLRIGACGDWCGGPRVEGAWLSGTALADRIGQQSGR